MVFVKASRSPSTLDGGAGALGLSSLSRSHGFCLSYNFMCWGWGCFRGQCLAVDLGRCWEMLRGWWNEKERQKRHNTKIVRTHLTWSKQEPCQTRGKESTCSFSTLLHARIQSQVATKHLNTRIQTWPQFLHAYINQDLPSSWRSTYFSWITLVYESHRTT